MELTLREIVASVAPMKQFTVRFSDGTERTVSASQYRIEETKNEEGGLVKYVHFMGEIGGPVASFSMINVISIEEADSN